MKTELYYRGKLIGRFATHAEAVHHYIDHLYVRGVDKFCDGVVLRDECGYCTIRSQFVGTRKRREYMMASRFGGILFDTMDSKKMNKAKLEKIRKDVLTIISEQFGVKFDDIKDTDTADSLGGDSLDSVECAMALEEHFEVEVKDEVIEAWKNVGECIQYFIDSELGSNPASAVKPVHPSTVTAVKKAKVKAAAPALDVPSIAGFAHRAEVEFKQIKFRFGIEGRKGLKKVEVAEQKATDKALAAGVKADKLATAIVAESKAEAAVPVVQPRLNSIRLYLVRKHRAVQELVAGPFASREPARTALRNFLMANKQVDPRQMHIRMGRELNFGKFTVAKGLRLPKFTAPTVRTDALQNATAKQIAQRKAQQTSVNARRAVIRASRLVKTAIRIKSASLYVLDKRDRIVAGPFNTLKAAHEVCMGFIDQYVQTGARCRNDNLKYIKGFKPATPAKVTGGMFAVGVPMMVAAVRTKITTYDAKTKTVCTALGTVHSCANFFINYSNETLAVA